MGTKGEEVDLSGLIEGADAVDDRVPHGKVLVRFAEAVLSGSDEALADARVAVIAAAGGNGFVDAAAVVGNFERMVRVADATGIPLDGMATDATVDLREELGLNSFGMASRTLGDGGS
ncbi:MAG: hypothetical protein O2910_04225 [Proteobacteria bacterium]|nr:hypothetical protein [Pseudomonadota bacterium]